MPDGSVLIITAKDEGAVPRVQDILTKRGQSFLRLDTDQLLQTGGQLSVRLNTGRFGAAILFLDGSSIEMEFIKSVWFRRPKAVSTAHLSGDLEYRQYVEKEFAAALRGLYTTLEDAFWMNHPLASRHVIEQNKLLQLQLAARSGLETPQTLVTNNPAELLAFCDRHGGTIAIKALHAAIFREADGVAGLYTHRVSTDYLRTRAASISACPLMAQEYIPKQIELRITIVGTQVLTCAIHSQDSPKTIDDWRRYDLENVKHEPYELPHDVRLKLLAFMKSCGLKFGAIDMIVTPSGQYVFLEVNPSGQFGWIEELTGLPISSAIAEALIDCP